MDEERFPQLIRSIYSVVNELEMMFPGRPFTPDGHMVGSIGECVAAYHYGLELMSPSNTGFDARKGNVKVEIKATQSDRILLRSEPPHLLVLKLHKDGSFQEIYNGPGAQVWDLVKSKRRPANGQYQVSLSQLRRLMERVTENERLPRVRA